MTVKELKKILSKLDDKIRVCMRIEDDDLESINDEVTSVGITEGHFTNESGKEEWDKYLFFKI